MKIFTFKYPLVVFSNTTNGSFFSKSFMNIVNFPVLVTPQILGKQSGGWSSSPTSVVNKDTV